MNEIIQRAVKIKEISGQGWNSDTKFQRKADAWSKNLKINLIDSIIEGYYIPPLLIANSMVIDGKQRLNAIQEFMHEDFAYRKDIYGKKQNIYYSDLSNEERQKFDNREIFVNDLGILSEKQIEETFLRINKGSIKLSKSEEMFAEMNYNNRQIILQLGEMEQMRTMSSGKENDKRFSCSTLIAWCFTFIYIKKHGISERSSVRNYMKKLLNYQNDELSKFKRKAKHVIEIMCKIVSNDLIPKKNFKTVFVAVFCAFYENEKSLESFLNNKGNIRMELGNIIDKIMENQMGGGTNFDAYYSINERVKMVESCLDDFIIDKNRSFSESERLKLWNNSKDKICYLCNKKIESFNDMEVDHVVPHSLGGRTNIENAKIVHKSCNRKKWKKLI